MELYKKLDMQVQSKIYKGVGHTNFEYSNMAKELDGISSRSIYASQTLKKDIALYYEGAVTGSVVKLDDTDRAERISPIPQLIRRYMAGNKDIRFLAGISEDKMMEVLQAHIKIQDDLKNIDRVYDSISAEELESMFKEFIQEGKDGVYDCLQDDNLRISSEQEAIKVVRRARLIQDREFDEDKQQK